MKKKTLKISESGGFFQILTHDDYEQINGIQLELFYRITYKNKPILTDV